MTELGRRINHIWLAAGAQAKRRDAVDERPGCAYGAVTRQSVGHLAEVIARVETKVNAILTGVLVALILEIVRSWRP